LAGVEVAYLWPKAHRICIATVTGRTGDVEVTVNWDVVPTESVTEEGDAP
jgi:hypothetical protein